MNYEERHLQDAAVIMENAVRDGTCPSAVVAASSYGHATWNYLASGNEAISANSIFPIASITKPIVATAFMQLIERGLLLLSDPVVKFIPEFGQNGKEHITSWHLLTHSSGLEESKATLDALFKKRAAAYEYFDVACESKLRFEPGVRYEYCNLAFLVLAELITRLSGRSYTEYLHENVFGPLNMVDTSFSPTDNRRTMPVHGFGEAADIAYFNSLSAPQGGLWSTTADLVAFGQSFLSNPQLKHPNILSDSIIAIMTRLHTLNLDKVINHRHYPSCSALAWNKPDPNGELLASDSSFGQGGGTGSFLWIDPLQPFIFVFLCNRWGLDHNIPKRVFNAVYKVMG